MIGSTDAQAEAGVRKRMMADRTTLLALALALLGLSGCTPEGSLLQSWWGPLDSNDGGTPFSAGGRFEVHGFGHRILTDTTPARDFVGISLVGAEQPISCAMYASYLDVLMETEGYVKEILELPREEQPEQWIQYVCQTIEGAATEAFGANGSYRSVTALMDVSDGGPASGVFRAAPPGAEPAEFPGAELLVPSTYVSRIQERSRHGEGLLPVGGDGIWLTDDLDPVSGCTLALATLIEEYESGRDTYPDHAAIVASASSHRYYHHYTSQEEIELNAGAALQVAWTLPEWDQVASTGSDLSVTLFGGVARAHSDFPYTQLLLSSQGRTIPIEPCPQLTAALPILWPEVEELGFDTLFDGSGGDDDDSSL